MTRICSALDAVTRHEPLYRDHLCCGNMAAVEFLLSYGRRMHSDDAIAQAKGRMTECLTQQKKMGEFNFSQQGYQPSFMSDLFYGISGIGYTLLRMLDAETPSALL